MKPVSVVTPAMTKPYPGIMKKCIRNKQFGRVKMFMETGCGTAYGNCRNAEALIWLQERPQCETGSLHRELAELTFLATFAREIGFSLNSRDVVLAAAKLLYDHFQYYLAVFSRPGRASPS